MSTQAKVKSVEVIEAFRASLVVFISKARPALEEVGEEVTRTRLWLESQRRVELEAALRKRTRELEEAQQALFSARIASLRDASTAEMEAVHRAKRAFDATQEKLAIVRRWNRDFPSRSEPLLKQLEKLRSVLFQDLPHAAQLLSEILKSLEDYAGIAAPLDAGGGMGSGSSGEQVASSGIEAGGSTSNAATSPSTPGASTSAGATSSDVLKGSTSEIETQNSKEGFSGSEIEGSGNAHAFSGSVNDSSGNVSALSGSKHVTSTGVFDSSKSKHESSQSKEETSYSKDTSSSCAFDTSGRKEGLCAVEGDVSADNSDVSGIPPVSGGNSQESCKSRAEESEVSRQTEPNKDVVGEAGSPLPAVGRRGEDSAPYQGTIFSEGAGGLVGSEPPNVGCYGFERDSDGHSFNVGGNVSADGTSTKETSN